MQWSQIKTLFILGFLVLNVYLLFQFLDKQKNTDYAFLEEEESPIDQQLASEDIILPKLSGKKLEESYISVLQKSFSKDEKSMLTDFDNQLTTTIDNQLIVSQFEKPVPVPEKATKEEIEALIKNYILSSGDYVYWHKNEKLNALIFFQVKNDLPVYFNQSGMLLVFLNEKNEMVFYTQTMLGEVQTLDKEKPLIDPIQAIWNLYYGNELYNGEEVTNVEVGYYTAVPLENGKQTLVPTWTISVNDERNYFVNAIEGFLFSSDTTQFLTDSITTIIDEVSTIQNQDELKESVLTQLNQRIEAINRSEIE